MFSAEQRPHVLHSTEFWGVPVRDDRESKRQRDAAAAAAAAGTEAAQLISVQINSTL